MEAIVEEREILTRGVLSLWRRRGFVDGVVEGEGAAGQAADRVGGATGAGRMSLVRRVLASRGFREEGEVSGFLRPSLAQLHDPSLMSGLDRAAERLLAAARSGEKITIYGDYDVDGVTATAILYHTLRAIAPQCNIQTYVPHRIDEGYGLNSDAIRELAAGGSTLIVTVDCGVTAVEPARVAKSLGVDLIITDHHTPPLAGQPLPDAYCVVHPRLEATAYPFGDLCGAGVAYKLAWRLCTLASGGPKVATVFRELLLELLGLCSLGVIADVVPLVGENRIITSHGLRCVKFSKIPGLRALVEASGLGGESVNSEDVGFKIAPRLNACGRLGHAKEAVELFTSARGERASEIARQLTRMNEERRRVERVIVHQAIAMVLERGMDATDHRGIVLAHAEWHAGVIGIVCTRLVERFHRPVVLLSAQNGQLHGSARSVDGFNLHGGLSECAEHLLTFGGHEMAAGMKLEAHRLAAFTADFVACCNRGIRIEHLHGRACFDCEADFTELSREHVTSLAGLGPFGRGNPQPCLRINNVRLVGRTTCFGSDGAHLKFLISPSGAPVGSRALSVFAWRGAGLAEGVPSGRDFDVLIKPKISDYSGAVEGELVDFAIR